MTTTPTPAAIATAIIGVLTTKQPLSAKVIAGRAGYPLPDVYPVLDSDPRFVKDSVVEQHASTPGRHFSGDGDTVEQDLWKLAPVPPVLAAPSPPAPPAGTPTPSPTTPTG